MAQLSRKTNNAEPGSTLAQSRMTSSAGSILWSWMRAEEQEIPEEDQPTDRGHPAADSVRGPAIQQGTPQTTGNVET